MEIFLVEECVKEIEKENGQGIYSINCDVFIKLIKNYATWEPKNKNDWNNENDLLSISGKAKECLSNIIHQLHSRKDVNVEFYKDLELPVE